MPPFLDLLYNYYMYKHPSLLLFRFKISQFLKFKWAETRAFKGTFNTKSLVLMGETLPKNFIFEWPVTLSYVYNRDKKWVTAFLISDILCSANFFKHSYLSLFH